MLNLDTTLTFFATSVLLALSPGPDNVFVLMHSAVHGRRAGLLVVLGLCSGLLFHTAAVALGLAALLAASAAAFLVLKLAGAGYLLYLAWGAWNAPAGLGDTHAASAMTPWKTYARGVVMNVTNPKVAIFFLAFLPQFVPAGSAHPTSALLLLGAWFIVQSTLFLLVVVAVAAQARRLQPSPRATRLLNAGGAALFAALAMRLVARPVV